VYVGFGASFVGGPGMETVTPYAPFRSPHTILTYRYNARLKRRLKGALLSATVGVIVRRARTGPSEATAPCRDPLKPGNYLYFL